MTILLSFFDLKVLLRLLTGVVLVLVAVTALTGVDVRETGVFSSSESESWFSNETARFLLSGAINLNISFWFSASIFDKSDKVSFLKDAFSSFRSSGSVLVVLLQLGIRFSARLSSVKEVSNSPDTNSFTAFLFWLLVVIFGKEENIGFLKNSEFSKERFTELCRYQFQNNTSY